MQININKIETIGEGAFQKIQSQTVAVYELMDGNPLKDEVIPVRMYLTNFDLTPSYRDKDKKFHVKYYLSLVLIEKNGRKYFKKREIWLWRKNFKWSSFLIFDSFSKISKSLNFEFTFFKI